MAALKACCKVLIQGRKIKKKLDAIEKAKRNAERERLGLEPIYSWHEKIGMNIQTRWRYNFLARVCPGYVYGWQSRRVPKFCRVGTFQNLVFRSLIAFLCGILLSLFWFLVMVYQLDYPLYASMTVCSLLGLGLGLGLAFSMAIRCVVLLMVPSLFSSKGRAVLLGYAFLLVMTHPVKNFTNNLNVMAESMTCGQQLALNSSKLLAQAASGPVNDMLDDIRTVLQSLVEFAEQLRQAFEGVRTLFADVLAAIQRVKDWLGNMVNVCNDQMGAPYKRCTDAVNRGFEDCTHKLGVGHTLFRLCDIVKIANALCHIARIGELFCHITSAITNVIRDKVKTRLMLAVQNVYDMFYFDVELDYFYQVNLTQSRTVEQISEDIHNEIMARMRPLKIFVSWTNLLMLFVLMLLVIKAVWYRRKYLTKDKFDNLYLTWELQEISSRRRRLGKDGVLPLKRREKWKYVPASSPILVKPELFKLKTGLVLYIGSLVQSVFFLTLDFGLFWLLRLIKRHGQLQMNHNVPTHTKMHVQGTGILADIYRALITQFDPLKHPSVSIDTSPCLPRATEPNWNVYSTIGVILGVCLFLVLLESYGLRLRHIITGYYHPERRQARAVWLANHIIRKRGTILFHLRRQMRKAYRTKEDEEKTNFLMIVGARVPCVDRIMRLVGMKYKYCLSCGCPGKPDDMQKFRHCENKGCKAIYCLKCYAELENMCTVCMNPLDYGDYSDVSEERDSSDEEGPKPTIAEMKAMAVVSSSSSYTNVNFNCLEHRQTNSENNLNLVFDTQNYSPRANISSGNYCTESPLWQQALIDHNLLSDSHQRLSKIENVSCGVGRSLKHRHWSGPPAELVSMDIFEFEGEFDYATESDTWSDEDEEAQLVGCPYHQTMERE